MTPALRIAAAGDLHASEEHRERIAHSFADVREHADLVLLAGDLTTHGLPEEAAVLADACRSVAPLPVVAVLGNHDHHAGRADEVTATLRDAGATDVAVRVLALGSDRAARLESRRRTEAFLASLCPEI